MAGLLKNLLFDALVPGAVSVYVRWRLVRGRPPASGVAPAVTVVLFIVGGGIYVWCVEVFASLGGRARAGRTAADAKRAAAPQAALQTG